MSSGGFRPTLVKTQDGVGPDVPFLASENLMVKRGGATVAQGVGSSVTVNGITRTVLKKGTFVVPATSPAGTYKVWATGDTINDVSGYTMESVDTTDGPVLVGILIEGSVLEARVLPNPVDTAIKTAVKGRILFQ